MSAEPLPPDEVHVWQLATGAPLDHPVLEDRLRLLSSDERARWERFRFASKKNEFLYGKLLTRGVLSRYLPRLPEHWTFDEAERGKPSARDAEGLHFNLSHTRGLLALAVTRAGDVGVDVEQIERRDAGVAERFFAPEEAAQVRAAAEPERDRLFGRFWTLKEAYIKAHGGGLSIPLASFRFALEDPVRIEFRDPGADDPRAWWFAWCDPSPAHALAVAVRCRGGGGLREPLRAVWRSVDPAEL